MESMMTVRQVAELLGVHENWVYDQAASASCRVTRSAVPAASTPTSSAAGSLSTARLNATSPGLQRVARTSRAVRKRADERGPRSLRCSSRDGPRRGRSTGGAN